MPDLPRTTVAGALAILVLAGCGGGGGDAEPRGGAPRPDVLVVLIDTLRADRLGAYGYERATSPEIDALARRGVVFRRASAQAPWTIPSVSSLLTGRYLTAHQERPDPEAPTMAEVFRSAGYRTLGVCANFVILPEAGFGRGFDRFVPRSTVDARGQRRKRNPGDFPALLEWLEEPLAEALAVDEAGERPPLFLYLQPVDPHAPYVGHSAHADALPNDGAPAIAPVGWQRAELERHGAARSEDDPDWTAALEEIQEERNAYDREVRYADDAFGRLLERLAALGVGEHLIVAIVSDHGEELWEHMSPLPAEFLSQVPVRTFFYQSHGYLLTEQALRTPFVLAGPGVAAGRIVDQPVENVDLFPTLMRLCDIAPPEGLHGRDLTPLWNGETLPDPWRGETFAYVQHGMTVREEASGLKLVLPTAMGLEKGLRPQLFDLRSDPLERTNLFDERGEDVARLTAALERYLARYPSSEQALTGSQARDLQDMMREFGYGGDMVRGPGDDGNDED